MTVKQITAGLLTGAIFTTSASAAALIQLPSDPLRVAAHIAAPVEQIVNTQITSEDIQHALDDIVQPTYGDDNISSIGGSIDGIIDSGGSNGLTLFQLYAAFCGDYSNARGASFYQFLRCVASN